MEIHAHAHTERKKFTHYLWEFLMLFFAVTLGFYAENLREGIKHKEEIKADMRSLLSDLRSDVAYMDSILERNEFSCTMADSVIELLHNDLFNTPEIYYCARSVTANFGYYYTNSKTFEQMKYSDLLKLVKPRNLLDSIANYYVTFQWLANQTELMRLKIDEIHKGNHDLFDNYIFHQMMKITYVSYNSKHLIINRPAGHPALLTNDLNKINTVALNYHYLYTTCKFYNQAAMGQRELAKRLIEYIKKEYSFD